MSNRERKRAERNKRKQRSAEPADGADGEANAGEEASDDSGGEPTETVEDVAGRVEAEERSAAMSRSERKNQEAREALEPLEEGERPIVITIGALVSAAIAASILIGWITGAEVSVGNTDLSEQPNAFQVLPPAILFAVMAAGMWRSRYWAVLGFEAIMAIIMIGSFITLIAATSAFKAISAGAILIAAALLFWFTVKALARIQMPEPQRR